MRHLNKFICASIFFLIITSNLFSQTYWHEMEFSKLIELTLDEVKESEYVAVQSGSGYIYAIGDDVKRIFSDNNKGAWSFTLTNINSEFFGGEVTTYYAPTVITNYGNYFQIVFATIPLNELLYDKVVKGMQEEINEYKNGFPEAKIEFGKYDERFTVTVNYYYKNEDSGELNGLIKSMLLTYARGIHAKACKLKGELVDDLWDEIANTHFKYLSKDYLFLLDPSYKSVEEKYDKIKEGYFDFQTAEKYNYFIYNYGDSIVFVMYETIDDDADSDQADLILNKMKKVGAEEFDDLYIDWWPGEERKKIYFILTYVFSDESFTYNGFYERLLYLVDDYFPSAWDELDKIQDDVLDRW
ncbi:MAG: hypothetical protein H6627_02850 [Calditrichae bacterium]|nr:hypothetical protein [Calditrichia bacterium]